MNPPYHSPLRGSRALGETPSKTKKPKSASSLRFILELVLFLGFLFVTGVAGYFVGHTYQLSNPTDCPPESKTAPDISVKAEAGGVKVVTKKRCRTPSTFSEKPIATTFTETSKDGGYSLEELRQLWQCSHAAGYNNETNQQVFPENSKNNLDKTKWKSILSVDPKTFFTRYLSQYPGDTRATQPVIVFSHRPLKHIDEIPEVCKVIDVAVVPDTPGVCVAVTETFHDVASYHMLHADRQPDGTFALTSNSIESRTLPEESEYAGARSLLLEFFKWNDIVNKLVKEAPKFGQSKIGVGVIIEDMNELELFANSWKTAQKQGTSNTKFIIFTTNTNVKMTLENKYKWGMKIIFLKSLAEVGTTGEAKVSPSMRRHFLQAWLAFAVANSGNKMLWQSPGTLWFDRPDNIISMNPLVESLWSYKGRSDEKAAPFFNSFDFFAVTGAERAVHLMHEIVLHFDLALAWNSLDAMAAYRLAENNARYGTTSSIIAPGMVLHADLLAYDPHLLAEAAQSSNPPKAIVIPSEGITSEQSKQFLQDAHQWYL